MRCYPRTNERPCIEVRNRWDECFPNPGQPIATLPANEDDNMNYKAALASLLLLAAVAAQASDPEPCNLAVVSRELPSKTKVCDSQTVTALARQGHVYEQNQLGLAAMLVLGPNVDLKTAAQWFQKSAEQGYAPAQVNLAVLYLNGWGVSRNYAAAQLWFRRAADAHYA